MLQGHAGTIPMPMRKDPMAAASEIISWVEKRCGGGSYPNPGNKAPSPEDALMCTTGSITLWPNAFNVVPGSANFSLDIRYRPLVPPFETRWTLSSNKDFQIAYMVELDAQALHKKCSLRSVSATAGVKFGNVLQIWTVCVHSVRIPLSCCLGGCRRCSIGMSQSKVANRDTKGPLLLQTPFHRWAEC